jgi:hypothetical protein
VPCDRHGDSTACEGDPRAPSQLEGVGASNVEGGMAPATFSGTLGGGSGSAGAPARRSRRGHAHAQASNWARTMGGSGDPGPVDLPLVQPPASAQVAATGRACGARVAGRAGPPSPLQVAVAAPAGSSQSRLLEEQLQVPTRAVHEGTVLQVPAMDAVRPELQTCSGGALTTENILTENLLPNFQVSTGSAMGVVYLAASNLLVRVYSWELG